MLTYLLTHVEFAAVAIFLNAESCPGLAIDLKVIGGAELQAGHSQLRENGHMIPAERPNTWHLSEPLMYAVLTVVRPNHLVLVRDLAGKRSMQFCLDDNNITAVLLLEDSVVLLVIENSDELIEEAIRFLNKTPEGQISVANVINGKLCPGFRVKTAISEMLNESGPQKLTRSNLKSFLKPIL